MTSKRGRQAGSQTIVQEVINSSYFSTRPEQQPMQPLLRCFVAVFTLALCLLACFPPAALPCSSRLTKSATRSSK
eukprot:COSAG01_NODE_37_length_34085_cov_64.376626_31_plen_75_part_00